MPIRLQVINTCLSEAIQDGVKNGEEQLKQKIPLLHRKVPETAYIAEWDQYI